MKEKTNNQNKNGLSNISSFSSLITKEPLEKTCVCGEKFETRLMLRKECAKCGDLRKTEDTKILKAAVEKQEVDKLRHFIRASLIPPIWSGVSFSTSDPKINTRETGVARRYATNFGETGLIVESADVGVGKTHIAICIANYVLHDLKKPVLFKTARDFLMELRQTFTNFDVAEADIYNKLNTLSLLVLDDVGRDKWTEWGANVYWSIFDRCMTHRVPVIITTNKPVESEVGQDCLEDRIGTAAYSRLLKICDHQVIHLHGKDLR